jgi:hypothetical protein
MPSAPAAPTSDGAQAMGLTLREDNERAGVRLVTEGVHVASVYALVRAPSIPLTQVFATNA